MLSLPNGVIHIYFSADLTVNCGLMQNGVARACTGVYTPPAADGSASGSMSLYGTDVLALNLGGNAVTSRDTSPDTVCETFALLYYPAGNGREQPGLTIMCEDGASYDFSPLF